MTKEQCLKHVFVKHHMIHDKITKEKAEKEFDEMIKNDENNFLKVFYDCMELYHNLYYVKDFDFDKDLILLDISNKF